MKPALLIIDMLNEYLLPNGQIYCGAGRSLIPKIKTCAETFRKQNRPIVYINTAISTEDVLAKKWGAHAIKGSKMAQVIDELAPKDHDIVVEKVGYDGFFSTNLDQELRSVNADTVVLTGIHTHVCVLLTGVGAFQRGYNVVTFEDCIATNNRANHESRLRFFESHIGELRQSKAWMSVSLTGA